MCSFFQLLHIKLKRDQNANVIILNWDNQSCLPLTFCTSCDSRRGVEGEGAEGRLSLRIQSNYTKMLYPRAHSASLHLALALRGGILREDEE